MTTCGTCGRPVGQPWRSHDPATGKIMHGCVDKSHTESLRGVISESARWHFRPEAKRIRAAEARHMREVLGPSKKRAKVVFLVPHMA